MTYGIILTSLICVIGVPVEEAKMKGVENIFKETMKNIPRFVDVL